MLREVRISAPAKVNLVLRVLDRRSDGYHNLWSLMQTVGVEDDLEVQLRPDLDGVRLQCDDPSLPTDGRNLVLRAAGMALDRARLAVGLQIRLVKRIPVAAGLGGGSSDAAATIMALNALLELGWSSAEMADLGAVLGSDVPFFFSTPTALVRGRGNEVVPVRLLGGRWIVLVNPGFPIETRWAYERLSSSRQLIPPLSRELDELSRRREGTWDGIAALMENDFESALAPTHPVLETMKRALMTAGAEAALLSGSGATVFGLFRREDEAIAARDTVKRRHGWWTAVGPACWSPSACHDRGPLRALQPG